MSASADAARDVLQGKVAVLDAEINWRTQDLVDIKAGEVKVRAILDELRQKRTHLLDAINLHFPQDAE
jgi:hypothetical protein